MTVDADPGRDAAELEHHFVAELRPRCLDALERNAFASVG